MNPLVSFLICAYNEPDLLNRALESIIQQTHRPIEIIVADDNSPRNLQKVAQKYCGIPQVTVVYLRNNRNLRPYWNNHFTRHLINGQYMMLFPHDDYFIDKNFVSDALAIMKGEKNCFVVIANSKVENTETLMMSNSHKTFRKMDGNKFLQTDLWEKFHPAYSGVIFDNKKLLENKYDTFTLGENEMKKINLEPDEWFFSIILAAEDSLVAVSGKVVSVRGNPKNSYSKSNYWQKKWQESCFIPQYQLIKYFLNKNKKNEAKSFEKMLTTKYCLSKINWKILYYLNFEIRAIWLMIFPIIKNLFIRKQKRK